MENGDGINLPGRDHDMLVTLNTKVDQLGFDVKDIKDSLVSRVTKVEGRLDTMDIYHAAIPLKHFQDNSNWVDGFRSNYKFILTLGGLLVAAGGAFIDHLLTAWFHF